MSGGGSGGGGGPVQSTTVTSNIPEYARPYVESMLGTAQQQIYDVDSEGNITGIKPYVPYSTDPTKYVAPFSPLQTQAQTATAGLTTPGQYATGSGMVGAAGAGTLGTAGRLGDYGTTYDIAMTDPTRTRAYMNPYIKEALTPTLDEMRRQYAITGTQEAGKATAQGAFGGSRAALMQAENARNQNIAMNKAISEGYAQAFSQAQQAQQAGLGMGLQGLQAQQSGYGQLGTLGGQLANIGQQQLAAQQGIIGLQSQQGAVQQENQQNIINQAIQNYAMAQQYPQQQLAYMSGLLRGLPLTSTSTANYQAAPSYTSQLAGLGTTGIAGLGLYNAMSGGSKAGG